MIYEIALNWFFQTFVSILNVIVEILSFSIRAQIVKINDWVVNPFANFLFII